MRVWPLHPERFNLFNQINILVHDKASLNHDSLPPCLHKSVFLHWTLAVCSHCQPATFVVR